MQTFSYKAIGADGKEKKRKYRSGKQAGGSKEA